MSIKILLIGIGSSLLLCGIVFIIKNIGGSGNNKIKAFGFEFESSNGAGALLLFLGFVILISGTRIDDKKIIDPSPPVPAPTDSSHLLTSFQLGYNTGELMWYEFRYKNNRTGDTKQQLPSYLTERYNNQLAYINSTLKEFNLNIDFENLDKSSLISPELSSGILQLQDLIENKKSMADKNAFCLGYYTGLFFFRCAGLDFHDLNHGYLFSISIINDEAKKINLPPFPDTQDDTDSHGQISGALLGLHVQKYYSLIKEKLGKK